MITKTENLEKLCETGKIDFNLLRYIPGLTKIAYQGQIYSLQTKQEYTSETYVQKSNLEFDVILPSNEYANFNNMHLCIPIKIKSNWIKKDMEMTFLFYF